MPCGDLAEQMELMHVCLYCDISNTGRGSQRDPYQQPNLITSLLTETARDREQGGWERERERGGRKGVRGSMRWDPEKERRGGRSLTGNQALECVHLLNSLSGNVPFLTHPLNPPCDRSACRLEVM